MQVTKRPAGPCTFDLDIEVPVEDVRKAFGRAYREFAEFTRVPGFRPGKAPRKVLENYVDEERLQKHVMESLARKAVAEALESEQISPYADPSVDFGDIAEDEAWRFRATVATEPTITLGDYSSIAVERPVYLISDEDVERSVETARQDKAELKPVEGRPVEEGDILIVDMRIDVEAAEPGTMRRSIVRVGQNIPGFDEKIIGQQVDETRTFTLTFPDDYQDAERAGKSADFTVTVAAINRRVLPDVTDEWVATLGDFANVAAWKQYLRADLEDRMRSLAEQVVESRIVDALAKCSTIEFPSVMVTEEVEVELGRLAKELSSSRMSYEQYLEVSGMTREQHEERLEQQAQDRIRTRLALQEFARVENLAVRSEDVDSELQSLREQAEAAGATLPGSSEDQRLRAVNRAIQRKLRERLQEIVTITDAEPQPI